MSDSDDIKHPWLWIIGITLIGLAMYLWPDFAHRVNRGVKWYRGGGPWAILVLVIGVLIVFYAITSVLAMIARNRHRNELLRQGKELPPRLREKK